MNHFHDPRLKLDCTLTNTKLCPLLGGQLRWANAFTGSLPLLQLMYMLCISTWQINSLSLASLGYAMCAFHFVDDVTFAHNGQAKLTHRWRVLRVTRQGVAPGREWSLMFTIILLYCANDITCMKRCGCTASQFKSFWLAWKCINV